MTSFDRIRQQASTLEIDVEIDSDSRLLMHKRGATDPRFVSLQRYDEPAVLKTAEEWLNNYRTFLHQIDQARAGK